MRMAACVGSVRCKGRQKEPERMRKAWGVLQRAREQLSGKTREQAGLVQENIWRTESL